LINRACEELIVTASVAVKGIPEHRVFLEIEGEEGKVTTVLPALKIFHGR